MKNLKNYTHSQYYNSEKNNEFILELIKHEAGHRDKYYSNTNEIIFMINGKIDISFNNSRHVLDGSGKMFFICSDTFFAFESVTDIEFITIRFKNNIDLCNFISLSSLKDYAEENPSEVDLDTSLKFTWLHINDRIHNVLDNIKLHIEDGFNSYLYLHLKVNEFFILMDIYYSQKDIYNFFKMLICDDINFIDFVRNNWMKYHSIPEIAQALDISTRQFSAIFKKSFGVTAYKWMKAEKSKMIHHQLINSSSPIKEIAFEYGFGSLPQFTKYCKTEIGFTPTEIREKKNKIISF